MATSTSLAARQRRALDQLKPLADAHGLYLAGGTAIALHLRHRLSRSEAEAFRRFPVASLEDLAVMKLSAIARRGIRRDFWDLHAIVASGALSLESALQSFIRRYGVAQSDLYHVLRALTYFDDADADLLAPEGSSSAHWEEIKAWLTAHVPNALR